MDEKKSKQPYDYEDVVKNPLNVYTGIKKSLQNLIGHIEGEEWKEANKSLMDFTKFVQMRIGMTGQDTKELHDDINWLGVIIRDPYDSWGGYIGTMKRASCREKLDDIVKMLADYGIYLGQITEIKEEDANVMEKSLTKMVNNLDYILTSFSNGETTKEEVQAALFQIESIVSRIPLKDKTMEKMRSIIISALSLVKDSVNAVQKDIATTRMIGLKEFAASCSPLRKWLKNLTVCMKNENYLRVIKDEIEEEEAKVGDKDKDDWRDLAEGNTAKRAIIEDIIRGVLEDMGFDANA